MATVTTELVTFDASLVHDCAATLRRVATYRLPAGLDRRLLLLAENKDRLTPEEKEELFALVELTEERTLDKLQAQAILKRLTETWPQIVSGKP